MVTVQEPTSGLDAATAYNLMSSLEDYARLSHKTIVVTIHQPSSRILNMFTDILLLSHGQVSDTVIMALQMSWQYDNMIPVDNTETPTKTNHLLLDRNLLPAAASRGYLATVRLSCCYWC